MSNEEEGILKPISIKVIGVGGAGGNVIERLVASGMRGADLMVANTDRQALCGARATTQLSLGDTYTRGLGAGGDPLVGQAAAEESQAQLYAALAGADMVFIVAGMGGGTGTGAAPVIAQIARELGALTVAMVTRPFAFEGRRREGVAEQGIAQLRAIADTIIIVPNERLVQASSRGTSVVQAFGLADNVLRLGIQGIIDLIVQHGMINVDFADIRAIMSEAGAALLGIGVGSGADRTAEAVRRAMSCPLLEGRIEGAHRLLLNITGDDQIGMLEINRGAELVARTVDREANIIFGAMIDPTLPEGKIKVTLVATGFSPTPEIAVRQRAPTLAVPVLRGEPQLSAAGAYALQSAPALPAARLAGGDEQIDLPPFLLRFRRS